MKTYDDNNLYVVIENFYLLFLKYVTAFSELTLAYFVQLLE